MSLIVRIVIALAAMVSSTTLAWTQTTPATVMKYYQIPATSTHPLLYVSVGFLSMLTPKPTIGLILFPGGKGKVNFNSMGVPAPYTNPDGTKNKDSLENNFLVRNRALFAQKGMMVAVVDWFAIGGVTGTDRLSQAHTDIVSVLIERIRNEAMYQVSRVYLVGTSSGTLSVLNAAAKYPLQSVVLGPTPPGASPNLGRPDGIVVTSTQTFPYQSGNTNLTSCGVTIDDVTPSLKTINVPAFVIWNQTDTCGCSPGNSPLAPGVVTKLGSKPGGPPRTGKAFNGPTAVADDQCTALTAHGFKGIDNDVVTYIVNSISPPPPPSNY